MFIIDKNYNKMISPLDFINYIDTEYQREYQQQIKCKVDMKNAPLDEKHGLLTGTAIKITT